MMNCLIEETLLGGEDSVLVREVEVVVVVLIFFVQGVLFLNGSSPLEGYLKRWLSCGVHIS